MELDLQHLSTAHCENGTVSALLRYHGINLSEPMIFGLASGIYFVHLPYVKMSGKPVTSARTFPGVFFKRVTKQLGIKGEMRRYLNKDHAMRDLDRLITERKEPVGCVVGMYYIPYLPLEYRFHFNGHNICVCGKDSEHDLYTVIDTNATQKVSISAKDLRRARFAKGGTYPLMGQMYWIRSVPQQLPPLTPVILKAIRRACRTMLSVGRPTPFEGVRGIRYLASRMRHWEEKMGASEAALNLAHLVRMLEEIGTGGAAFRFIYAAFLQEAAQTTGIDELNDFSQHMTEIGDEWRMFSRTAVRMFKRRHGEDSTYDDLADLLMHIAEAESDFFTNLGGLADRQLANI